MKTDENNSKHNKLNASHKERNVSNTYINPNGKRNIHEIGKMRLRKQNPYLFLMIWIRNEAPMRFENGFMKCLERR